MLRTAVLSMCLALAGYGCAAWLTHDFQVWTAEGARRLDISLAPVAAPAVQVDGPGMTAQSLSAWLADGKSVTVLDFAYTRCQTVCLALGSVYQQMQATLQAAEKSDAPARRVKLLTISFDGQHDTPPVLQTYAARLGADAALWRFVRVQTPDQTARLLNDFQVTVVPNGLGDFEHNAALLIIDQRGRLVRVFDYADQELALAYARDLAGASAL
jgi:protein SCO1/2